ncbi:hypothetical protein WJX72_006994 [[Myrmecia] bisecta]|uniref:Probable DNA helicase MCM9 n=1 Tax=[Myrmecia] bisecta TaxID=41462 RepID=A0AAW1QRG5_9CHLO
MQREEEAVDSAAIQAFVPFLLKTSSQALEELLLQPDPEAHYAIPVSLLDLAHINYGLAESLLQTPKPVLRCIDAALLQAQHQLMQGHPRKAHMAIKERVHARLASLPHSLDSRAGGASPSIGNIRSVHVNKLLTVSGTVVRSGAVQMLEAQRLYECAKCKHRFVTSVDLELGPTMQLPTACPSPGPKICKGVTFQHIEEVQLHTDYQEIRVQEKSQCVALGAMPRSITVILQDELADCCQAGDDVEVTGIVTRQWRSAVAGARCNVDLVILANALRVANQAKSRVEVDADTQRQFDEFWAAHRACPLRGRNKILASICPQIFGLFTVKLATMLMLAGGVQRVDAGGTAIRGEVHMLLVGDPGTGKSQFLKYAAKLSPRAVMTSGKGTSSAGLTVTAVKDGGQWALEAGALVLADGGLCCIDEFNGIREAERATIHEAMEQQTLSVAKAGLVTTLSTRATVFGVTNPKGTYKPRQSLADNTGLSGPLLSRFDIVLVLLDLKDPEWDSIVSEHILTAHQQRPEAQAQPQGWTIDMLQKYLCWVKATFQPVLSSEAEQLLLAYYQSQRQALDRSAARTTIRMLESIIRIAQAHARLTARHVVTLQDAVVAVLVAEASMHTSAILGPQNVLHSAFAEDPDAEYAEQERQVLAALRPPEQLGYC